MMRETSATRKPAFARKAASLLVAAALVFASLAGCSAPVASMAASGQSLASTGSQAPQPATLTVEVQAPDWLADGGTVSVQVKDQKATGASYGHALSVVPNTPKQVSLDAGEYDLSVVTEPLNTETVIWKTSTVHLDIAEGEAAEAAIELAHDAEAMEAAAAAAQAKAEEEAKAAADEAEARAKAEAEAQAQVRAQAEAEAQAQREAAAAASAPAAQSNNAASSVDAGSAAAAPQASSGGSDIVYVTASGECYHRDGCSSLSKSKIPMSRSEAAARYRPCSNCRP